MNFGIYGGSMIARFHALAISNIENSQLVAVFARKQSAAEKLAKEFGCKAYWKDQDFFGDPSIDIITVATPSGAHLEPALKAAAAGKHCICEKPLEISPDRVDTMVDAYEKAQLTLSGIFNRRFNPAVQALKNAVDQNRFGKLALAGAAVRWYREPDYFKNSNWKGTLKWEGGGALMNQSIHAIDQLLYLMGPVKTVSAFTSRATHETIEVEDTAVAILQFANGARGVIEGSTACWSQSGNPAEIYIHGDAGSVVMDDDGFRQWEFRTACPQDEAIRTTLMRDEGAAGMGSNDPSAINSEGHKRNFENVVNSITNKEQLAVDGREARKAVALIAAIYESASNNGQPVRVT